MAEERGRPTDYTPELADYICDRLSNGTALITICSEDGMPDRVSVYRWLERYPDFCNKYEKARDNQLQSFMDDIQVIADNGVDDMITKIGKDGREYECVDHEHINRSRLRIETRIKIMEKMRPKKYGSSINLGGQEDNPLKINEEVTIGDDERDLLKQFASQLANKH